MYNLLVELSQSFFRGFNLLFEQRADGPGSRLCLLLLKVSRVHTFTATSSISTSITCLPSQVPQHRPKSARNGRKMRKKMAFPSTCLSQSAVLKSRPLRRSKNARRHLRLPHLVKTRRLSTGRRIAYMSLQELHILRSAHHALFTRTSA